MMGDELRQSFALLPGGSEPRIWVAKPGQSGIKKFICRRSTPTSTLPVEGPTKNELCRTIVVSSHPSEPMVNERRLPDTGPSNDCDGIDILVCPCCIQERNIFLPTKDVSPGNG